ncbi:MAG: hypothetical protein R6T91_01885 [Bacteroidales bacterium]
MKKLLGLLLIPLMAFLIHNRFANGHYHHLPNGEVVYHYHPYHKADQAGSEEPFAGHQHSKMDFLMIALFFGGEFIFLFGVLLLGLNNLALVRVLIRWVPHYTKRFRFDYSDSRAPPVAGFFHAGLKIC